ncbi:CFEM domain protein [Rhizoctonia solani 123E]|uniref:CFEM domain protein n=1 Tax=Rhizoctonia solani 123E TaxID=1423351 RepID=A0A074SAI4_9AGAM|nr:CFEM domain protein [Rhizoctonia solani 123E]
MRFTIATIAALAFVAFAQNVPPCVKTCSDQAATANGCGSHSDVDCVCTNAAFQTAARSCIQSKCTAAEMKQALDLQASSC